MTRTATQSLRNNWLSPVMSRPWQNTEFPLPTPVLTGHQSSLHSTYTGEMEIAGNSTDHTWRINASTCYGLKIECRRFLKRLNELKKAMCFLKAVVKFVGNWAKPPMGKGKEVSFPFPSIPFAFTSGGLFCRLLSTLVHQN